jgi:RNA polymerase sigma-70 factor (ECF subfamily)
VGDDPLIRIERAGKNRVPPGTNTVMLETLTTEPPSAAPVALPPALRTYPRLVTERALADRAVPAAEHSEAWLTALRAEGAVRDRAVARLHDLLLGAARFELSRRRAALSYVRGEELDDLATQAADDALVAVLGKLDDFRGASRFTTWAYKFALFEAGVRLRRRAWQDREVVLEPDDWGTLADRGADAYERVAQSEQLDDLRDAIESELTAHQRRVFIALALNEVPIDVLSERLDTTRGALYKTLHDARRKLRDALERRGG